MLNLFSQESDIIISKFCSLNKYHSIIELDLNGRILSVNQNFLKLTGYNESELKNKYYDIFLENEYKDSPSYKDFWSSLSIGKYIEIENKILTKDNEVIWIFSKCCPVYDAKEKLFRILIVIDNITNRKEDRNELLEELSAVSRSQAIIHFDLNGIILDANENFLEVMGYNLNEIKGRHHSIFVDENSKHSIEYKQFWDNLSKGTYQIAEYKRIARGGKEVWINASYNPVFDLEGRPKKIVKFATDITDVKMQNTDFGGQIIAINRSQAVIQFDTSGVILDANQNFLDTVGYSLDEIKGKHHSIFVEKDYQLSPEYKQFWESLKKGTYQAAEYKRIAKGGRDIWIQASYNPIFDLNNKVFKIVKYATDITQIKLKNADYAGQIEAINRSQAVIEFDTNGLILYANNNFLNVMGYTLDEVKGKHHGIFVESNYKTSFEYQQFWESLKKGTYQAAEYKRITKGGKEVWIQASYNPIYDLNGKVSKIVKYATDITDVKALNTDYAGQIDAINKSQAVIEFDMSGKIINANQNFLDTVGYSLDEIRGKQHSIFIEKDYQNSEEYKQFWENLNRGIYQAAEYKRIAKGGKEVWIQASYNPIFDLNGNLVKVVKFATDITSKIQAQHENERGVNEINKVLQEIATGNLSLRIDGEYTGTFAEIKGALNSTIEKLTEIMHEVINVLKEVYIGNLTTRVNGDYNGSFLEMKNSINNTVEKLIDIVVKIKNSSETVSNASSEISLGSTDLSKRTESQAASLEETAASMEELTGTVRKNSENTNEVAKTSMKAKDLAQQGGAVVKSAISAMAEIEKSSKKVSNIISVIDEIAFQTNLLALNAAVEAARAGDAGRGFAVVASEVRSLAGRSSASAKEIRQLIEESNLQVESGSQLVDEAGKSLEEIVSANMGVNTLITEISNATKEQTAGIEEVSTTISQMDEMTQQNAALVEENTAALQSLVDQANQLKSIVTFFKIDSSVMIENNSNDVLMKPQFDSKPIIKKPILNKAPVSNQDEAGWEEF